MASLIHLLFCILALVSVVFGAAETAPANANCKEGASFYREPVSGIAGCYKLFATEKTWYDARDYCTNPDCTVGFCGELAAARTQGEHDLLVSLAGPGIRFWIAANSLSVDTLWRWDGYFASVNFNQAWVKLADLSYSTHTNQVILAGRVSPYNWDFALPNSTTDYYICRKSACSPTQDIENGLCSSSAASVAPKPGSNNAWIAAPIVIGALIVLVLILILYVWRFHNDKFLKYRRNIAKTILCCTSSATNDSVARADQMRRVSVLTEENERLRQQLRNATPESLVRTDVIPFMRGGGSGNLSPGHRGSSGSVVVEANTGNPMRTSGTVSISAAPVPSPTMSASVLPTVAGLPKIRRPQGANEPLPPLQYPPPQGSVSPITEEDPAAMEAGFQQNSLDNNLSSPQSKPFMFRNNRVMPAPPASLPAFLPQRSDISTISLSDSSSSPKQSTA